MLLIDPGAYATEFLQADTAPSTFVADHTERPTFDLFSSAIERTMIDDRLQSMVDRAIGSRVAVATSGESPRARAIIAVTGTPWSAHEFRRCRAVPV